MGCASSSRATTLMVNKVKPIDGNACVKEEAKALRRVLPAPLVARVIEYAWDPRFVEITTPEPGMKREFNFDGSVTMWESRAYQEISHPSLEGEAPAGGQSYPVVCRYRNGLRRTINMAWGTSIYVCTTGQRFEDVDTAMRCQNDFVRGVPPARLTDMYPMELIPV
mmetsp:Transcript_37540/g.104389  ORF Transcript_37540/g.104389 Transcript_37540/m.104389 type:complete len:166 (-) Transcript_37540:249-746(-)|eukprot:CAMPEP_0179117570 /NCGR_PEP_ID=MMETSP0796-20121207/55232_1 /TAXON_ID=73915 /ORGANISM="Pyrodinium bahamense, Strain pbaha01" /LENGTH=165 /DNA_ID=CAMNT_0020815953 /DNA_START=51 /DNA_END=548 /DNA_ORIENTATION=-